MEICTENDKIPSQKPSIPPPRPPPVEVEEVEEKTEKMFADSSKFSTTDSVNETDESKKPNNQTAEENEIDEAKKPSGQTAKEEGSKENTSMNSPQSISTA